MSGYYATKVAARQGDVQNKKKGWDFQINEELRKETSKERDFLSKVVMLTRQQLFCVAVVQRSMFIEYDRKCRTKCINKKFGVM